MVDGTGLKGISTLHFLNRVFPCKLSNAPFLFLISNVISALNLHPEVGGGKGAFSEICAFKRSSIHLKIEKDDDGTVVAYPSLRQVLVSVRIVWSFWIVMNLDRFLKMLRQGRNIDQNNFLP